MKVTNTQASLRMIENGDFGLKFFSKKFWIDIKPTRLCFKIDLEANYQSYKKPWVTNSNLSNDQEFLKSESIKSRF